MRIGFIYSEVEVEIAGGEYFHNFLGDVIDRYSKYGELTVCVSAKTVASSDHRKLPGYNNVDFRFLIKENTIRRRYLEREHNIRKIEKSISEVDFVIVHVPCSVQGLVTKFAAKYNKPYMALVVGCPKDSLWNHSWRGKLLAPGVYLSLRKFMRHVPYAMYVTQKFLQRRYPCHGVSVGCSDVALPSLDSVIIEERKSFIKSMHGRIMNIVSVGAMIKVKGHDDVIKAISLLKRQGYIYHYHIVGGGDGSWLERIAEKLNVSNQVFFHGLQPHDKIFDILKTSDIYVQPSRTEGLARALAEAISVGCPALATDVGGNTELIPARWTYRPGKIKCLADRISELSHIDNLLASAEYNFNKAKEYQGYILDKRRDAFIKATVENTVLRQC